MSTHWMPLYIGDYLADTGHLTAQEHGAYLLLLMHHWKNGPLPSSEKELQLISKIIAPQWCKIWPRLKRFFDETPEGFVQKRLMKEKKHQLEISAKRAAAGKKGGRPNGPDDKSKSFLGEKQKLSKTPVTTTTTTKVSLKGGKPTRAGAREAAPTRGAPPSVPDQIRKEWNLPTFLAPQLDADDEERIH